MTRTNTFHLDYPIRHAALERLEVNDEFARKIVNLAQGSGTVDNSNSQRVTADEAKAIVFLARQPEDSERSVLLAGSGVVLNRRDAAQIVAMAQGNSPRLAHLGSGGQAITGSEAREVLRVARRAEGAIGRVTQAEVDRVERWSRDSGQNLTPAARQALEPFIAQGADHVGRIDPAVRPSRVVFPQYNEMFADGVFDHMVVIGFDETGAHLSQIAHVAREMAAMGFQSIEKVTLTPEEVGRLQRLEPRVSVDDMRAANAQLPQVVRYFVNRTTNPLNGESVIALQRLVLPVDNGQSEKQTHDQAVAKEAYIRAHMGQVDGFFYGGHARYGTGPDIDHIDSSAGNIRLAQGYSTRPNAGELDVHKNIEWANRYQLLVFAGCTTAHYLPSFERAKFRENRDIIVTNQLAYWTGMGPALVAGVSGIMEHQSFNEMVPELDAAAKMAGLFEARYLSNNTFVPWPQQLLSTHVEFAPLFAAPSDVEELAVSRGDHDHIRLLQHYLSLALLDSPPLNLDGDGGPTTQSRIMEFKRRHGIKPPTAALTSEFLQRLELVVQERRTTSGS